MSNKSAKCERCGVEFDCDDGYAYINYGHVASDLPLAESSEYDFALCTLCEEAFNQWLDRGVEEYVKG